MAALIERYLERCRWTVEITEVTASPSGTLAESAQLLPRLDDAERVIALDERGADMTSTALARQLEGWQDGGCRSVAFVIGGADGLHQAVRQRADILMAFGRATWPHMLVRVMLAEQLYRAGSILAGHPYHRQ